MKIFSAHIFQFFLKNPKDNFLKKPAPIPAWPGYLPVAGLPAFVVGFAQVLPAWCFMWLLAAAIFAGCKWLTWWESAGWHALPVRSVAYFVAWPGMDARAFLESARRPAEISLFAWAFAIGKTLFGAALLWVVVPRVYPANPMAAGWVGMVGVIFVLHFGFFHVLSLAWQRAGVNAKPLMHWPIAAQSLGSFWGDRWNRGFNDITVRHVFRPLCPRVGVQAAMLAAFLVSGALHDAAITVPARGGYGQPTLYFLIQAGGLLIERSKIGRRLGLRHGIRGWAFTMAVVAVPVGILFPPPFVERVMVPFFRFLHIL